MEERIRAIFEESAALQVRFGRENATRIAAVARRMAEALRGGGKILFCGNGGSAADAQHLAAEFVNRFHRDRRALAALALTTDTAVLTSIGNDSGFDRIFSRQVEALARRGDLLVAISCTGSTGVTVHLAARAKEIGAKVVALTADPASPLAAKADRVVHIPVAVEDIVRRAAIFEHAASLCLDAVFNVLSGRLKLDLDAFRKRHANLE
jgi:D-sedoheptulose 7-phosphate isomerase